MPRPRTPNGVDRVLDAAEEVFRSVGVRDAGIAEIARLAGVGPGTVYRIVQDKETLFQWTLVRAWDPAAALPADLPLTPIPRFQRRFRELFDLDSHLPVAIATAAGDAHELRPLLEEQFDIEVAQTRWLDLYQAASADDEHGRIWWDSVLHPMGQRLATALQHLVDIGEVAPGWPVLPAAYFIVVNCAFFGRTGLRDDPVIDPDPAAHRKRTIRRIERALRLPPSSALLVDPVRVP